MATIHLMCISSCRPLCSLTSIRATPFRSILCTIQPTPKMVGEMYVEPRTCLSVEGWLWACVSNAKAHVSNTSYSIPFDATAFNGSDRHGDLCSVISTWLSITW